MDYQRSCTRSSAAVLYQLLHCYLTTFLTLVASLKHGQANGIIAPIHKGGSKEDPKIIVE